MSNVLEICRLCGLIYHNELSTTTNKIALKVTVDSYGVSLPYFFDKNQNLLTNQKAEMIWGSIKVGICGCQIPLCGCPLKVTFSQMMVVLRNRLSILNGLFLGEHFWTDTNKLFLDQQYDGIFGPTKKGVPQPT